jgi:lipopolysaccharide/colanic/teichoic acid biosynthesis glycosyltransferase
MLILLSPLFLVLAAANKIDCPRGSVFYRQERVGLERRRERRVKLPETTPGTPYPGTERRFIPGYGRIFKIWKFRTMVPDAEARSGPVWASVDDPRVTRLGRTLRNLRLDELPQLINVVAGQMSLIGPRPERLHFVGQLATEMPTYERRLHVSPGITGLAQVEREYDASILDVRTKLKYDIFYVENRSRLMDMKIILKTVDVMLRGRGAR